MTRPSDLLTATDALNKLKKKMASLEQKNRVLSQQIAELRVKKHTQGSEDFVSYRGALFKRDGKGSLERDPYCPKCRKPMTGVSGTEFDCFPCGYIAPFGSIHIRNVLAEAKKRL